MSGRSGFSAQTLSVLAALCAEPSQWCHGYALAKQTGLKSGTLYPVLIRLADRGLVEACWQDEPQPGRPRRHLYRLTVGGLADAAVVQGYGISMQTACVEQHPGANVALWWFYYNPYSWYCGNYTTPAAFNYMGEVNVQAYCARHFPGTYAELSYVGIATVYSWVCAP